MDNIKASINEDICSCNGCHARNYENNNEKVVEIYDVQMGSMVIHMCAECMDKLIGAMARARAIEEGGKQ